MVTNKNEIDLCDVDVDFFYKIGVAVDEQGQLTGYVIPNDKNFSNNIHKYHIGMVWHKEFMLPSDAVQSLENEFVVDEIKIIEQEDSNG